MSEYTHEQTAGDQRERLVGPRYYDASKNPEGAQFHGVPLRDLEAEEFEALPLWLQHSVDQSPLYRRTKPRAVAPETPPKEE